MHADLPRDVAWCRDADNISKVRAANVDLGCYNVTDTPPCSYRLFVPDGFSMQLPVVSEMQCTIPTSLLVYVGDVANKPRKVHNCTFSLLSRTYSRGRTVSAIWCVVCTFSSPVPFAGFRPRRTLALVFCCIFVYKLGHNHADLALVLPAFGCCTPLLLVPNMVLTLCNLVFFPAIN